MKRSQILMYSFWGYFNSLTIFEMFAPTLIVNSTLYFVASTLSCIVIILAWLLADSQELHIIPSRALKICVLALAIIAVPYYLIKYKGWRRSINSFSKFLGFLAGSFLILLLVGLAKQYA